MSAAVVVSTANSIPPAVLTKNGYPNLDMINGDKLTQLLEDSVDWAHAHGMVMRTADDQDHSDLCQTAPFTLFPSPFPSKLFHEAMQIQQAVNLLYFRVSWDFDFLINTHAEVVKTDEFTRHMISILEEVRNNGAQQKRTLLIQRNDYMYQSDADGNYKLRQIEVNNIAASMGSLAERASRMHRRTLKSLKVCDEAIEKALPDNQPIETIANGIFNAWSDFGDSSAIILFIVEDENQNQIDQRHVEYRLDEMSGANVVKRITLTAGTKRLCLEESSGNLLLDKLFRVAVVYFRAAYAPDNFPTENEWNTRRLIELSTAIKSPSIAMQLANTKKVQQVLTLPGGVERFLSDSEMCQRIRDTFAGIWGLEKSSRDEKILQDAIAHPDNYVLKPQLEGGHGNYYGKQVAEKLKSMSEDELAAHILMERIRPVIVKNFLVRLHDVPALTDVVGELGIYAYLYGSIENEATISNHVGGHIIRSKGKDVDKGGVAIGAAFVDSPFLF